MIDEHRRRQRPHRRSLPSTSHCRHPATFAYRSLTDDLGAGEAGCRLTPGRRNEAYVPDLLGDRRFRLDGEVTADVADAERAITALDATAKKLVGTEALARLLLHAESVASSSSSNSRDHRRGVQRRPHCVRHIVTAIVFAATAYCCVRWLVALFGRSTPNMRVLSSARCSSPTAVGSAKLRAVRVSTRRSR
jgi:hypothetical protein